LLYSVARVGFLSEPEPIAPSLELLGDAAPPGVTSLAPASSEEIRSRPLFWSSRRPAEVGPVVEENPEDQSTAASSLDKVQLVGIFGAGESAGIITLVKGKKQRILLGEDIEGWTLEGVEPDRAIFKDKGRSQELVLKPAARQDKS